MCEFLFFVWRLRRGFKMASRSASFKNPPVLKDYKKYKQEVELWRVCCKLEKTEQGPALALSLPDNSIKEKLIEELGVKKLGTETGVDALLTFLDKYLLKEEIHEAYDAYTEFDSHEKLGDISMEDYIIDFEKKFQRIKNKKMDLPDHVLAFRLLDKAHLDTQMKKLVISGVDYEEPNLLEQMTASLKKFCGKGMSMCSASDSNVKVIEEGYYGASNAAKRFQDGGRGSSFDYNYNAGNAKRFQDGGRSGSSFDQGAGNPRFQDGGRSGSSFGSRPRQNKMGEDGKTLQCHICGSVYHFASRCPDKSRVSTGSGMGYKRYNKALLAEVQLFTGNHEDELLTLVSEARNSAVLDSGCPSTVTGKLWLSTYLDSLSEEERDSITWAQSGTIFKFGAGPSHRSTGSVSFPCTIGKTSCRITADVVDCNIPLLFGRHSMKKAGTVLHLDEDRATMFGEPIELETTTSGHYCVPLHSQSNIGLVAVDSLLSDSEVQYKQLEKLHKQFAHPSERSLLNLLSDAGVKGESIVKTVGQITSSCEICKRFRKTQPRPVTCVPLAHDFNDVLTMDLKFWRPGTYFFHMIDAATRFSKSVVIRDKRPATIIDKFMLAWVGTFGKPKKILTDNGGEFANTDFLSMAQNLDIEVLTTPAYSPWSNGLCERNHCVIDENVAKLLQENPTLSLEVALTWACNAKNSLSMVYGYSPYQLVFGRNPNLPSVLSSDLPALENVTSSKTFANHLEALHNSREAFIKAEASDRIRRALRSKTRNYERSYQTGDKVYYQRDGKWKGPGKVVGQDGKVVLVRHGSVYVKVHLCRLTRQDDGNSVEPKPCPGPDPDVKNEDHAESESDEIENDDHSLQLPNASSNTNDQEEPSPDKDKAEPCEAVPPQPLEQMQTNDQDNDVPNSPIRRSARNVDRVDYKKLNDVGTTVYSVVIPKSEQNSSECLIAKKEELEKLIKFQTYDVVEDQGQHAISTRWVMTTKEGKPRARLVARGFEDDSVVQSDSPTVGKSSMRLFLVLAASQGWTVSTTDIASAFLQGQELKRDVFVKPPKEANISGKLWRLKRCLYGLNDAARQFYLSVCGELAKLDCEKSSLDPSVYCKFNQSGSDSTLSGMLLSHIDDFLHAGDGNFDRSVMGPLRTRFIAGKVQDQNFSYVGFQIVQKEHGITLDMNEYVEGVEIPKVDIDRQKDKSDLLSSKEQTTFRSIIGSLNWIVQGVRPDVAHELTVLSVKSQAPTVKDLLRAVKLLSNLVRDENFILIPKLPNCPKSWKIVVFTDASHANQADGISSTYGLIVFIFSGKTCAPLSWRSGKIRRVVRSTLAAETLALVEGLEEAIFHQKLLSEIIPGCSVPILGVVDNKSLVESVRSTKSVDDRRLRIDIGEIKEMLAENVVDSVMWCPGSLQISDCLTKIGADGSLLRKTLQTGHCSFLDI